MLYTGVYNRFQEQHLSLRAPSTSVASTKAVVMGLSLTCPLLCTPRLFPNQRWVPWPRSLFLAPSGAQRFTHSLVFMHATMSKQSHQPSKPCSVFTSLAGGCSYLSF